MGFQRSKWWVEPWFNRRKWEFEWIEMIEIIKNVKDLRFLGGLVRPSDATESQNLGALF